MLSAVCTLVGVANYNNYVIFGGHVEQKALVMRLYISLGKLQEATYACVVRSLGFI